MLKSTKNITLNGRSEFEVEGQSKIVATMTAVVSENGSFSKNENVIDVVLYEAHKAEVQADMKSFSELAYEMATETAVAE